MSKRSGVDMETHLFIVCRTHDSFASTIASTSTRTILVRETLSAPTERIEPNGGKCRTEGEHNRTREHSSWICVFESHGEAICPSAKRYRGAEIRAQARDRVINPISPVTYGKPIMRFRVASTCGISLSRCQTPSL